jgi:hypothetical protein
MSGLPFLPLGEGGAPGKERLLPHWIFLALSNEPIKIQRIWFADRNFAFKNLLSYFLLSPFSGPKLFQRNRG